MEEGTISMQPKILATARHGRLSVHLTETGLTGVSFDRSLVKRPTSIVLASAELLGELPNVYNRQEVDDRQS